jgi:ABC-type enterobactin transport system permease subunit
MLMGDELGVTAVEMESVTGNDISSPSVIDGPLFAGSVVALVLFDDSAEKLDIVHSSYRWCVLLYYCNNSL